MDLDAFRWLLTGDGQRLLAAAEDATGAEADPLQVQIRPASYGAAGARRRRPDPGRAAPPGRDEVRRPRRADVLHPRRARAGHPAAGGRAPRRPGRAPPAPRRWSTSAAASAATWSRSPGPALTCAGRRPRPPARRGGARPTSTALGLGGAVTVADATDDRHHPLRRRVRRPGAPYRARAHLRRRRLDAALVLRRVAADPRLLREARARHSPTSSCPTASRPSGSATTARSRRPCSGRAGSPPPAGARPSSATAGWPPSPTRTTRAAATGPGRRVPLRARRRRDPGRAGDGGRRRGRWAPARRAHRLRHLRRTRSARRSPAATGCSRRCRSARSRCGPRCASAGSAG